MDFLVISGNRESIGGVARRVSEFYENYGEDYKKVKAFWDKYHEYESELETMIRTNELMNVMNGD